MKVKKLKLIGAVSASIALLTSSVTSITAFADVSPVPGSSFAYDFTASVVTEEKVVSETHIYPGDVEVTFQITNNPGMLSYTIQIYNGVGYEFLTYENNSIFHSGIDKYNENTGCLLVCEFDLDVDAFGNSNINFDNFYVKAYFRPNEDLSIENSNFSIALTQYDFPLEGKYNPGMAFSPDVTISSPYVIGDMDGDGYIDIVDAGAVESLGATAEEVLNDRSVININNHLITEEWKSWFPKLLCAEIADADENGLVDSNDTKEVLRYYSNNAAAIPIESLVGKTRFKTIYVRNV